MSSTSSFSGCTVSRSSAQVRHLLRLSETLLDMSRFQPELQLTHISRKLFSEPLKKQCPHDIQTRNITASTVIAARC